METTEKALEILERTEDGEKLHPFDLKLLEMAVNGFLSDAWLVKFEELHADVMAGRYQSAFEAAFHGIAGLRIDRQGYVYWQGVRVEHYDMPWCWGEEARGHAHELAARCLRYEDAELAVRPGIVWEDDPTIIEERDGLRVGDYVWYWLRQGEGEWVRAILQGFAQKGGAPVMDVYIIGDVYPTRWGYAWQVAAWSEERPADPRHWRKGEA